VPQQSVKPIGAHDLEVLRSMCGTHSSIHARVEKIPISGCEVQGFSRPSPGLLEETRVVAQAIKSTRGAPIPLPLVVTSASKPTRNLRRVLDREQLAEEESRGVQILRPGSPRHFNYFRQITDLSRDSQVPRITQAPAVTSSTVGSWGASAASSPWTRAAS
jgi:hypothetical protein